MSITFTDRTAGLHSNDPGQTSFVFKCTYNGQDAIVKLSPGSQQLGNNALETERWMYQNVVPKILEVVPGRVIRCLAVHQYTKKPPGWPSIKNLNWNEPVHALVLERASGETLRDLLEKASPQLNLQELLDDVLLQCAAVLDAFQRYGVMHNDLHCGNVFVKKLTQPEKWKWDQYEFESKWKIQLYDFDHASKTATAADGQQVENTLLTQRLCKSSCECNKFEESFDWWGFLQGLYSDLKDCPIKGAKAYRTKLAKWVKGITTEEVPATLNKKIKYTGKLLWIARPCTCAVADCTKYTLQTGWLKELGPPSSYLKKHLKAQPREKTGYTSSRSTSTCGVLMLNGQHCGRVWNRCQYHFRSKK